MKRIWSSARFVRQTPNEKQTKCPNRLQSFYRARYYDVTTGEFTGRDPMEYVDGMSLMRGYMGIQTTDPTGNESITVVPKGEKLGHLGCSARPFQSWDFRILGQVPCIGWFVQKVTVTCWGDVCGTPDMDGNCCWDLPPFDEDHYKKFSYFEAWPVTDLDKEVSDWRPHGDFNDQAKFGGPEIDQTRGSYYQRGIVKYFCSEDGKAAELGIGDLRDHWHNGATQGQKFYGVGTVCATTPDELLSTNGDNNPELFAFWDDPRFDTKVTSATRSFFVDWQCCFGCKRKDRWLDAFARPTLFRN